MKKSLLLIFTLGIFLLGLFITGVSFSKKVTKSGKAVTEIREVGSFSELTVSGVFDVHLLQGEKESIKIETDGNLLAHIKTEIIGEELKIEMPNSIRIKENIKTVIQVTLKDIKYLELSSIGKTKTLEKLVLSDIDVKISGVGNTDLEIQCESIDMEVSSVGNTSLIGSAKNASFEYSGTGNVHAKEFETEYLAISASGVGDVTINATKEINLEASGVGNVKYTGGAVIKRLDVTGIGNVKRI